MDVRLGGGRVAGHAGLWVLGEFCDAIGLARALSKALPYRGSGEAVFDRGAVLVRMLLVAAGGGEACSDIEVLRAEPGVFGAVPSTTTVHRTFTGIDAERVEAAASAVGEVRQRVWPVMGIVPSALKAGLTLDMDASFHVVHSESKQGAAAGYKGYGFHPLYCTADITGEVLSVKLRPGNAAANSITDHAEVLDAAVEALGAEYAAGHRRGDDPGLVRVALRVRADSAGCTDFVWECRERSIGFSVVARRNAGVESAVFEASGMPELWEPALPAQNSTTTSTTTTSSGSSGGGGGGDERVAEVADLTGLVDTSRWPDGTRLIVRREPLHPGAQRSLLPSDEYRYWGHWTDSTDTPAVCDRHMRAHAHVESTIERVKDAGGSRFPFTSFDANSAWLLLAVLADTVVRWFQWLCLRGPLSRAKHKALRWRLWHTPARIVRHARKRILKLPGNLKASHTILAARIRINLLN